MTRPLQNPRTMAIAYRIWADCQQYGWYRTISEVADSIGEPAISVRSVIVARKWQSRFRSTSPTTLGGHQYKRHELIDHSLEAMS